LKRFKPCAGFFQFLFCDICPQSFYGVYDWWGVPKKSLRAFDEACKPIAVIGRIKTGSLEITVVNDFERSFECMLEWTVVKTTDGQVISAGEKSADIPVDCAVNIAYLPVALVENEAYRVALILKDKNDKSTIALNIYDDILNNPQHPEGHYNRMSHELGVRLFNA